jgi:hypothetical protein
VSGLHLPNGWREDRTSDGQAYFTDSDRTVGGREDGGPALYVTPAVPGAPADSIDAATYIEVGEMRLTLDQASDLAVRLNTARGVAVRAQRAAVAAATPAEDRHVCPRREEAPPGWVAQHPDHDWWEDRRGVRCCSWCGSVNPDDVMAHLRDGSWALGPTDKNYKAYVSVTDVDHDSGQPSEGKHVGKFYFQHLSDEQRREFINRLNAKAFPIGMPGHFYVLPFFAQRGPAVTR